MTWQNILKLKKYTLQEVKDLLLNEDIIAHGFKGDSPWKITNYLFYLIYFDEPLTTNVRMKFKRLASKAKKANTAKLLSDLSIGGGKIIENDRILPFSKEDVSVDSILVSPWHSRLSKMYVEMEINLFETHSSDRTNYKYNGHLNYIDIEMSDGLYNFDLIKDPLYFNRPETIDMSTGMHVDYRLENAMPFIQKVLSMYNPQVKIIGDDYYWSKSNPNLEEIKDAIKSIGDKIRSGKL